MSGPRRSLRPKVIIALALCLVAGFVDAVGYLVLDRLLPANMSGNTVGVAMFGARGKWSEVFRRLWPIVMFVAGLVSSGALYELRARHPFPAFRVSLLVEGGLLGAFMGFGLWGGQPFYLLVGLGALAMGMQNASLRRVGPFSVFTTHITGTLTKFGESLIALIFWVHHARRKQPHLSWHGLVRLGLGEKEVQETFFMGGLWWMFLLGALGGVVLHRRFGLVALVLPMALLLVMIAYEARHPIDPRGEG